MIGTNGHIIRFSFCKKIFSIISNQNSIILSLLVSVLTCVKSKMDLETSMSSKTFLTDITLILFEAGVGSYMRV